MSIEEFKRSEEKWLGFARQETALIQAKESVIQAAQAWYNGRRSVDGIGLESELFYSVQNLEKLKQPADPVKELVRLLLECQYTLITTDGYGEKIKCALEQAAKAFGMERK